MTARKDASAFARVALAGLVALLAFSAGVASLVQNLAAPDSLRAVQQARAAGVTVDEAEIARTLAEADLAQAQARATAGTAFLAMAEQALGLLLLAAIIVIIVAVFLWGVGLIRRAQEDIRNG